MTTSPNRARIMLGALAGVGLAASAMTATGVYAPATDVAHTGPLKVRSAAQQRAIDLRLAPLPVGEVCGSRTDAEYSDNLTTPLVTIDDLDLTRTYFAAQPHLCLKNFGVTTASVQAYAVDKVQADVDCTGDEATVDPTCGGNGLGELVNAIAVEVLPDSSGTDSLLERHSLGTLAPGATIDVRIRVGCCRSSSSDQKLAAQSDEITFRIAFEGSTA